jgi:DNA-binding MarR family transcriptional regulator
MSEQLHTAHLEELLGYNTRRAALHIIGAFMQNMEAFDLRPAEFSVLSLIRHNPGITSRQLCAALSILPPNLVVILKQFEKRGLIARKPHPTDGRAIGLSLTDTGETLVAAAEEVSAKSDVTSTPSLTATERKTLTRLLKKIYLSA